MQLNTNLGAIHAPLNAFPSIYGILMHLPAQAIENTNVKPAAYSRENRSSLFVKRLPAQLVGLWA